MLMADVRLGTRQRSLTLRNKHTRTGLGSFVSQGTLGPQTVSQSGTGPLSTPDSQTAHLKPPMQLCQREEAAFSKKCKTTQLLNTLPVSQHKTRGAIFLPFFRRSPPNALFRGPIRCDSESKCGQPPPPHGRTRPKKDALRNRHDCVALSGPGSNGRQEVSIWGCVCVFYFSSITPTHADTHTHPEAFHQPQCITKTMAVAYEFHKNTHTERKRQTETTRQAQNGPA